MIKHEDLIGTYEQKRAVVAQFNLMDDTFFSVVMEHNDAAEYLLSQLLGKKIKVVENKTQYSIRNAESHSIVLDALIQDDSGKLYDVEIQVGDHNNHERRIRYYHTAIDWSVLKKGKDYSQLPDLYMIFISDFDPFKRNRVCYEVAHYIKDTDLDYDNGIYIKYFNTSVDDGTFLSELLQYLKHSDPNNDKFGVLSQQVRYHKILDEGVDTMCKAVEEYAKEYAREYAKGREEQAMIKGKIEAVENMLKDNIPLETALKYVQIDRETYEKHTERMQ